MLRRSIRAGRASISTRHARLCNRGLFSGHGAWTTVVSTERATLLTAWATLGPTLRIGHSRAVFGAKFSFLWSRSSTDGVRRQCHWKGANDRSRSVAKARTRACGLQVRGPLANGRRFVTTLDLTSAVGRLGVQDGNVAPAPHESR